MAEPHAPTAGSEWSDWAPPWLSRRAAATPDALAIEYDGTRLSYAALQHAVSSRAAVLQESSLPANARVALVIEDPCEFAIWLHAVHAAGATAVPLHLRLSPREHAQMMERAECAAFVHDAARAPSGAGGRVAIDASQRGGGGGVHAARSLSEDAVVLFTSGTSGEPKGARLRFANFLASAQGSARLLPLDASDRWLACMPLYHVGGLSILLRSVLAGSAVSLQRGFDAHAVSRALDEHGVTIVSLVPIMLRRLLDAREGRSAPDTLRCVLLGGAAAPAPWVAEARALGFRVAPTYGLTEACSQVATARADTREGGGLQPLPGLSLRIVAGDGSVLPSGAAGEIEIRGASVSPGYLGDPERAPDAWFGTGDFGRVAEDGSLEIHDRRDDLIVSGGENIYPAQIEAVLLSHPSIAEAAVAGRADGRFGQRPVAFIVPRGAMPGAAQLDAFCRERLAGFQVPDAFVAREALPRSGTGKLLRRVLRETLREESREEPGPA